tara:strand:+ start:1478 stop:1948 length:471 start_codon:yes stop_codon:yes gene_type:complete
MSILENLKNLNLDSDAVVSLSYSEGTDVFVHNETEVETALSETDVVNSFAELVSTPGLNVSTQYGGSVLESLREEGLLDDYGRDYTFSEYLAETITDNFYDVDLIDYTTEKYDHKRGFCTLSADVNVTMGNVLESSPCLVGWKASVETDNGTLVIG